MSLASLNLKLNLLTLSLKNGKNRVSAIVPEVGAEGELAPTIIREVSN